MNEKEFQNQLDTIAQEDTPEKLNIWENIRMELQDEKPKKQKRAPSRYPWLRYAAVFATLLGLGLLAYLFYGTQGQVFIPMSSYSDSTLPEDLVSDLNLSQTVNGVTITIDWVYADANRAALAITTSYMSDLDFDPYCMSCTWTTSLRTADGQEIPPAYGGGGGGGGGGPVTEPYLISTSSMSSYDTTGLQIVGDKIELIFTTSFNPQGQTMSGTRGMGGSGGGGGGGGGSADMLLPTPTIVSEQMPVREYRFEFSIPFYHAQTGRIPSSTLENNGIAFDLANVSVTPSMQRFDLCYSLPSTEEWYPNVLVYTGRESAQYEAAISAPLVDLAGRTVYLAYPMVDANYEPMLEFDYENMRACGDFVVQAPYEGGDIEIMIPYLYEASSVYMTEIDDSTMQAEYAYFADQGIEFIYSITTDTTEAKGGQEGTLMYPVSQNPSDGFYIVVITKHPETMTSNEAVQYVLNNWMRERYDTGVGFPVRLEN